MTLREKLGGLGLVLAGGVALAMTLMAGPFVQVAHAADADGDGLSDALEDALGTDPNDSDSDGDSWSDWKEAFETGTDPKSIDSDGDTLPDNSDSAPLNASGSVDGVSTADGSYSENLTAACWKGTSAMDGKGFLPHSGEFVHSMSLLDIDPGYGPSISFGIYYRSGILYNGPLGMNWDSPMFMRLVALGGGDVDFYDGRGRNHRFRDSGDPPPSEPPFPYTSPAELIGFTLTKNSDSTWTLFHKRGTKWEFGTGGNIVEVSDRFGNTTTYTYTNGLLTDVEDATGHTLAIDYYANTDRVYTVTDDSNRVVVLSYDCYGQLARVRTPLSSEYGSGRSYRFTYTYSSQGDPDLNHNLIRAKDPKGQVWLKNEYDEDDRVVKQYLGADYFTFSYSGSVTTVTDRAGNQRDWTVSGNLPTSLKEYSNRDVRSGDPAYWETFFGHTSAGLRNKVVYPRGNRIDTTYDVTYGNVTEIRRRTTDTNTNDSSDIVETFAYDTSHYHLLTSHTDSRGNTTTYTIPNSGDLAYKVVTAIDYPDVTYLDPDQETTVSFTWNSHGQLVTATDGEGKETEKIYFEDESETGVKMGYLKKVTRDSGTNGLALMTQYDYKNWGMVSSVTNPRSKTTTYFVNEYDWVTQVQGPINYEIMSTFDANGNVTQRDFRNVDEDGYTVTANPWWTTTYTYDILDNPLTKTEEITSSTTRTWEFAYTANEKMATLTKPEGNEDHYVYDERDLVYQRVRGYGTADEATERWDYDGNRNATLFKNGRNRDWTSEFDSFDRKTRDVNPLGHYTEYVLDKGGNVTEVKRYEEAGATDVLMAHTKQYFDERARLYRVERGLKGVSSWAWTTTTMTLDERGLVTMVRDPRNKATSFTYDGAGRRILVEDALGNQVETTFDANGNPTYVDEIETTGHSTAKTFTTEMVYDDLDRRTTMRVVDQTNSSNKHTTTYAYTSLNVMVEKVDAESNATTWTHDGLGRVLSESIALGGGAYKNRSWGFDDNGRLVSHKDDAQNETTWAFNARDLVTTETYADSGAKTFDYDDADNLIFWDDPMGTEVDLTYDDNNRSTARDITRGTGVVGAQAEDYLYDALDRMTEAKDDDVTVQFTWDSLGRKTAEISGPNPLSTYGKTTGYTYDDAGNITQVSYPDGSFAAKRTFDDVNRPTLVEDGSLVDIVTVDYYGAGGRLKKLTFGNATTGTYGYDGFRWVSAIDHEDSGPSLLRGYDLARDSVGNILYEEKAHDSGKGHNYAYDPASRLTSTLQECEDPSNEHANPGSEAYSVKLDYNLSDDSDRTSVVSTLYQQSPVSTSYTSNSVHEYTAIGATNRNYDNSGNLEDDGTREFAYDYRNQLVTVTRESDSAVIGAYEYDALGRRTRSTYEDDSEIRFYHDGLQEIEEFDGNGTLIRKYVYREEIDSLAMMEAADIADVDDDQNTSELVRLFYHFDGRTNVIALTDPSESIVESYECDPYGNLSIKDKNGSGVSVSQVRNPFVFQRRRHDSEAGLMYFRSRHYDPEAGQWLQRDPLGYKAGANLHEAWECSPTNRVDPLGLDSRDDYGWDQGGTQTRGYASFENRRTEVVAADEAMAARMDADATESMRDDAAMMDAIVEAARMMQEVDPLNDPDAHPSAFLSYIDAMRWVIKAAFGNRGTDSSTLYYNPRDREIHGEEEARRRYPVATVEPAIVHEEQHQSDHQEYGDTDFIIGSDEMLADEGVAVPKGVIYGEWMKTMFVLAAEYRGYRAGFDEAKKYLRGGSNNPGPVSIPVATEPGGPNSQGYGRMGDRMRDEIFGHIRDIKGRLGVTFNSGGIQYGRSEGPSNSVMR